LGRTPKWFGRTAALLLVLAAGCTTPETVKQLPICPGKGSAEEALAVLNSRAEKAVPLRVSGGQCRLTYFVPDDDEEKRHNLPLQLWFHPPSQIYIQGSIAVDSKALIVGCNDEEFWLALRPKEMSAYYYGQWDETANVDGLVVSPQIVLEAFGIIAGRGGGAGSSTWSLSSEGAYDVLTLENTDGKILKRVHIYTCDYLVRKIEYFDREGKLAAMAELDEYEAVVEGFQIPTKMLVTAIGPDGRADVADIKLASLKQKELSEAAREQVFARNPGDMDRFEKVYHYQDGKWTTER
jgi:hypothetical protein